jgi:AICAR transformylase/IMP cyclohydrolase PurH
MTKLAEKCEKINALEALKKNKKMNQHFQRQMDTKIQKLVEEYETVVNPYFNDASKALNLKANDFSV